MNDVPYIRVIGVFIVVAIVASIVAVVGIGMSHGWMIPKVSFWAVFDNHAYVNPGDPVTLAGFTVGEVRRIHLTPDLNVVSELRIERRFLPYLKRGTIAVQEPAFLIGSGKVRLRPESDGPLLEPGDTLETMSIEFDLPLILAAMDITKSVTATMDHMREMSENLARLSATFAHPDSALRSSMRSVAALSKGYAYGDGLIRALGTEDGLRTKVDSALIVSVDVMMEVDRFLERTERLVAVSESVMTQAGMTARMLSETSMGLVSEVTPLIVELRQILERAQATWPLEHSE